MSNNTLRVLRSRGYEQIDVTKAQEAAEALAEAICEHAGPCACRLCQAWEALMIFNVLTSEKTMNGQDVLIEEKDA